MRAFYIDEHRPPSPESKPISNQPICKIKVPAFRGHCVACDAPCTTTVLNFQRPKNLGDQSKNQFICIHRRGSTLKKLIRCYCSFVATAGGAQGGTWTRLPCMHTHYLVCFQSMFSHMCSHFMSYHLTVSITSKT